MRASGALYCWAQNGDGEFGNGTTNGTTSNPVTLIPGITMPTASYP